MKRKGCIQACRHVNVVCAMYDIVHAHHCVCVCVCVRACVCGVCVWCDSC